MTLKALSLVVSKALTVPSRELLRSTVPIIINPVILEVWWS
jgi:hypothetical protein